MIPFKPLLLAVLAASTVLANPLPQTTDLEQCGPVVCAQGTTCCNPSCGICTPPGVACTMQACQPCGDTVCQLGTVCCNDSCGICAPPGEPCTTQLCQKLPPKF
ncbi:hypothetical protein VTJ49DRAFT_7622 [Mycothermus thermophilus]|uniref:Uncharacterized protein n=1 Tax=Humicola insolens TaxID=85995 RepID=A0ABR3VGE3_HUMIN